MQNFETQSKQSEKPEIPKADPQKVVGILMMEAGTEFVVLIAVPLIAGIFAGKWLDNKTHHGFYVIIGILAGLALSVVAITSRIKDYKKNLDTKLKK